MFGKKKKILDNEYDVEYRKIWDGVRDAQDTLMRNVEKVYYLTVVDMCAFHGYAGEKIEANVIYARQQTEAARRHYCASLHDLKQFYKDYADELCNTKCFKPDQWREDVEVMQDKVRWLTQYKK